MADVTNTSIPAQGFLVPHATLAFWEAESTYTQAGPRPGVPVPDNDGQEMVLLTSGTQSSGGSIDVLTVKGGFPSPNGAQVVWRDTGDTNYRGWDPPHLITGYESIDASTTAGDNHGPHVINLKYQTDRSKNDILVLVYTIVSGSNTKVVLRTRSLAGTWSNESSPYSETSTSADDPLWPCLLELPSGRLLLFNWTYDGDLGSAGSEAQITMSYSDDQGTTWAVGSKYVLPTAIDTNDYTPKRIRAATNELGQVMLVVDTEQQSGTARAQLAQYASDDRGHSFTLVDAWAGSANESGAMHDLVYSGGYFVLLYLTDDSATGAYLKRVSSTYENFTSIAEADAIAPFAGFEVVAAFDGTNHNLTAGTSAMAVDSDGSIYAYVRATALTNDTAFVVRSDDDGLTWNVMSKGPNITGSRGSWWFTDAASAAPQIYPDQLTVTVQRGRVVMVCHFVTAVSSVDPSLFGLYFGGWTSVTMPGTQRFGQTDKRVGWQYNWIPVEIPSDAGWNNSTAGTPTISVTSGYLSVATGAGGSQSYNRTAGFGTQAEGVIVMVDAEAVTGTFQASGRISDGANYYGWRCDFTTTAVSLYDMGSGTLIATKSTTGRTQILVGLAEDSVYAWFRDASSIEEDREWSYLANSDALTSGASTTSRVSFGTANANTTYRVYQVHYVADEHTGEMGLEDGITNPDDLYGRALSGRGKAYLQDGVSIASRGGPAFAGDSWVIAARYDYPITNLLTPSPRKTWRSTSTAQTDLAFSIRGDSGADAYLGRELLGIHLENTNINAWILYGYDQGTGWVRISSSATASFNRVGPLTFTRAGNTVRPTATTSLEPFIQTNEFLDGYFVEALNTNKARRIEQITSGAWNDEASGVKPVVTLADVDDTESTGAMTGAIVPGSFTIVIPLSTTQYSGFRLRILAPSADTYYPPESYWYIGAMVVGPVLVSGIETSWGHSTTHTRVVDMRESEDGTRDTRVRQPHRRTFEVQWSDGLPSAQIRVAQADPDFIDVYTDSNSEGQGIVHEVASMAEGMILQTAGSHKPMVFLRALTAVTSGTAEKVLNRRGLSVYGRVMSDITIENVAGREFSSTDGSIDRVMNFTFSEEK